jgi:hypothetical protein
MAGAIHYRDTDHINNIPVDVQHPLPVQILEPSTSTDDDSTGPGATLAPQSAELKTVNTTNLLLIELLAEVRRQNLMLMEAFSLRDVPDLLNEVRQLPI